METRKKSSTLQDVARKAGVSRDTVSVVLNGSRSNTRVSEATRASVLHAARELNYHPNAMARGLVRRRVNTLGVLFGQVRLPIVEGEFATRLLQGITRAAGEADYNITLFTRLWEDATRSLSYVQDRRTDGVIVVTPPRDSEVLVSLAASGLPVVVVDWPIAGVSAPFVYPDDATGGRMVAEHLLALGHRRVAFIMGGHRKGGGPVRREAFIETICAAGGEVPPELRSDKRTREAETDEVIRRMLSLPEPPTAIFAGNDSTAVRVLQVAAGMGITVPEQLSVVGCYNFRWVEWASPALTTLNQPLETVGAMAARLLIERIEGKIVANEPHLVAPSLIVRGSTAACLQK
ncbi:MAG: LacI family DNA-binding transcriptional regulator [Armatimonadaceae bacterium]